MNAGSMPARSQTCRKSLPPVFSQLIAFRLSRMLAAEVGGKLVSAIALARTSCHKSSSAMIDLQKSGATTIGRPKFQQGGISGLRRSQQTPGDLDKPSKGPAANLETHCFALNGLTCTFVHVAVLRRVTHNIRTGRNLPGAHVAPSEGKEVSKPFIPNSPGGHSKPLAAHSSERATNHEDGNLLATTALLTAVAPTPSVRAILSRPMRSAMCSAVTINRHYPHIVENSNTTFGKLRTPPASLGCDTMTESNHQYTDVGDRLRTLREWHNMSQREWAEKHGFNPT